MDAHVFPNSLAIDMTWFMPAALKLESAASWSLHRGKLPIVDSESVRLECTTSLLLLQLPPTASCNCDVGCSCTKPLKVPSPYRFRVYISNAVGLVLDYRVQIVWELNPTVVCRMCLRLIFAVWKTFIARVCHTAYGQDPAARKSQMPLGEQHPVRATPPDNTLQLGSRSYPSGQHPVTDALLDSTLQLESPTLGSTHWMTTKCHKTQGILPTAIHCCQKRERMNCRGLCKCCTRW